MNRFSCLLFAFMLISACSQKDKDPNPGPVMKYINLNHTEAKKGSPQRLDLDEDGTKDFTFTAFLVGDPVLKQDRLTFVATSTMDTYLLSIENTETGKRMNGGELVGLVPPSGFQWFEIALVVLTEKITPQEGPVFWRGDWKDASHHFLAVQIKKNGSRYNGWVELSMDTTGEKIILHKAAISLEPNKNVKTGY